MVFDTSKEPEISFDPMDIPQDWPRLAAIDYGMDHPTAVVWGAHDLESDTLYIYDLYYKKGGDVIVNSAAINSRNKQIPLVWPKDGLQRDKGSGIGLAQQYRDQGVNMLHDFFRNETATTKEKGGQFSVEAGISELNIRINTGRLKVASHLTDWFDEFRSYHRKEGNIVAMHDDAMSATRYLTMSLRFATQVSGSGSNSGFNLKGDLPIQDWAGF